MNPKVMNKLSYGIFIVTAKDGDKDNGCIINTGIQVTTEPNQIAFALNKGGKSRQLIGIAVGNVHIGTGGRGCGNLTANGIKDLAEVQLCSVVGVDHISVQPQHPCAEGYQKQQKQNACGDEEALQSPSDTVGNGHKAYFLAMTHRQSSLALIWVTVSPALVRAAVTSASRVSRMPEQIRVLLSCKKAGRMGERWMITSATMFTSTTS